MKEIKHIKAHIQSLGVKLEAVQAKEGGAGPAEGDTIILGNDTYATVPISSSFVSNSPFSLSRTDSEAAQGTDSETSSRFILKRDNKDLIEVLFPEKPEFYSYKDKDGTPYWKIALRHGKDCLATTVMQKCMYWGTDAQCRFCGIELSLENNRTIALKTSDQLAGVAEKARDLDNLTHVTLTTGTQLHSRKGIEYLCECISKIKERARLVIHIQVDPLIDASQLELIKDAGASTLGLHIESFDFDVLKSVAPAKARFGLDAYNKLWEKAIEIFGKNQVSSFLIAGLGETEDSIINGSRHLARMGVYPFILPLRPIPGSLMGDSRPPEPDKMIRLYEAVAAILSQHDLSSQKSEAGCVRCGACTALTEFEN